MTDSAHPGAATAAATAETNISSENLAAATSALQPDTTGLARPLAEHIVLVTGGARGLGAAISEAFLREGARVIINYRHSQGPAEELAARYGERALAYQADIRDPEAIRAMFDNAHQLWSAPVSVVVNNALLDFSFNGDARSRAPQLAYHELETQFLGSVQGPLHTIQAALPGMRELGAGRIINIGTNLFQNPVVPYHDYTAAKAALLSLTRTFAADLGPEGITVNMVSGGLLRSTDASAATPAGVFDAIAASTPLTRVTTPQELADAVLFFASPWSRGVTGQNLIVDGGLVKG